MDRLPTGRFVAAMLGCLVLAIAVAALICLVPMPLGLRSKYDLMTGGAVLTCCLATLFVVRWYARVLSARGYATGLPPNRRQWEVLGATALLFVALIALSMWVYGTTHDRVLELGVAFGVMLLASPVIVRLSEASAAASGLPRPPLNRGFLALYPALFAIDALNLYLQSYARHVDPGDVGHEFLIAAYAVLLGMLPAATYASWKRFRAQQRSGSSLN